MREEDKEGGLPILVIIRGKERGRKGKMADAAFPYLSEERSEVEEDKEGRLTLLCIVRGKERGRKGGRPHST